MRFVSLLFFAAAASSASAQWLSSEQQIKLDAFLAAEPVAESNAGFLERCAVAGDDDGCMDGFECIDVHPLGSRCVPVKCIAEGMAELNKEVNMNDYVREILATAGIGLGPWATMQRWAGSLFSSEAELGTVPPAHMAIRAAVQANPGPRDRAQEVITKCSAGVYPEGHRKLQFLQTIENGDKTGEGFFIVTDDTTFDTSGGKTVGRTCEGFFGLWLIDQDGIVIGMAVNHPDDLLTSYNTIVAGVEAAMGIGAGLTISLSFDNGAMTLEMGFATGLGGFGGFKSCDVVSGGF